MVVERGDKLYRSDLSLHQPRFNLNTTLETRQEWSANRLAKHVSLPGEEKDIHCLRNGRRANYLCPSVWNKLLCCAAEMDVVDSNEIINSTSKEHGRYY